MPTGLPDNVSYIPPIAEVGQQNFFSWLLGGSNLQDNGLGPWRLPSPMDYAWSQGLNIPGLQTGPTPGNPGSSTQGDIRSMPLFPGMNQNLNNAFANWQPWDAGTMWMANYLSGGGGVGQSAPWLQNMMDYGAAGQGGQPASLMAQYGVSGEGAGRPLVNLAYGNPGAAGQYLIPFLTGQRRMSAYQAPDIQYQPRRQRNA